MSRPENPPPVTEYRPDFLPAYVSNGVVGLRVGPNPLLDGTAVVSGVVGVDPVEKVQGTCYVPYPLAGDLRLNAWWMSQQRGQVRFEEQHYDFHRGELLTRFAFVVDGVTARVDVVTFCSRPLPSLACQETRVMVEAPCRLTLRASIDPQGVPGECLYRDTGNKIQPVVDGTLEWQSPGGLSRLGIAYSTESSGPEVSASARDEWGYRSALKTDYVVDARPGEVYSLRQVVSLIPELWHHEPDRQAIRMAFVGKERGFDRLRAENQAAWEELWRGRVLLHGAERAHQAAADAAFFYLHASVHPSSPSSTGLFGLGQWRNYHYFRGHVFWDIETFTLPPLLLTAPDCARALLDYRSRHLGAARANARMNGYQGLQFPWESSTFGEEVTPNGWPHIIHEQHISLDVALAFAQYAHVTGDSLFRRDQAWPVLLGVAEWIVSRVVRTARGYEIREVTGIDEGASRVDNNAWTNASARMVLREASECARALGYPPPDRWQKIEAALYLAVDPATSVLQKYDGFADTGGGVCPDALAVLFPLGLRFALEVEQATYRYYLERRHGYIGYPMLSAPMCVWAARTGDRALARELFERGLMDFVFEPFRQFDEFGSPFTQQKEKVGPYLAHCGGLLLSLLYGLTGMHPGPEPPQEWGRFPIVLPQGWEAIEVERCWVQEQPTRLVARQGQARLELTA